MPRPNLARSIASEAKLAKRIAHEREDRGLSYEGLAKLMTDAGCAIQGSAIYKIEKGDPPRRVTVDELVALARVFEAGSIDEMLTPVELVERRQAQKLIAELGAAGEMFSETIARMMRLLIQFNKLADRNSELFEYVDRHWAASEGDLPALAAKIAAQITTDDKSSVVLEDAIGRLIDILQLVAGATAGRQEVRIDERKRAVPLADRPKGKAG